MSEDVMLNVNAEMDALKEDLEKLKRTNTWMRDEMSYQKGMIEGLKFAIRCNGVSGAEAKREESYYC